MLARTYGTITKDDLLCQANSVIERFNNANFKVKEVDVQRINRVEVVSHNTAVYFWCSHMCNFVVYGGSKRGTYEKLHELLIHICFEENKDYINISDFIVKR